MRLNSLLPGRSSLWSILLLVLSGMVCAGLAGCGQSMGAVLYTMGAYPSQKIPAEYSLPKGNLLILVDDDRDLIQPATAREVLVDELAKLLKEHELVDHVTTNEEIIRLRREEPKFDQRGAREVGKMANADTVLWLSTIDFSVNNDLEMAVTPARFSVMLKVLDVKAEKAGEVRLWPLERDGRLVEITISPQDLHQAKSLKEAHEKMATALSEEIAKLFYEQTVK